MSAYWRVKTYCILVGAHENWKAAEVKHRKLETNRKRFTQLTQKSHRNGDSQASLFTGLKWQRWEKEQSCYHG
jgi:hypothetical protein